MAYPTRKTILAALALSFACDTGHVIHASIILPKAIAAAYSPEQRGLLVASFSHVDGGQRRNIAVVCGDTTTFETEFSGDGERKEATIQAWILADAAGPCGPIDDDFEAGDREGDEPKGTVTVDAAAGCEQDSTSVEITLALPD